MKAVPILGLAALIATAACGRRETTGNAAAVDAVTANVQAKTAEVDAALAEAVAMDAQADAAQNAAADDAPSDNAR